MGVSNVDAPISIIDVFHKNTQSIFHMKNQPSVLELRCDPIPLVRIGLIGLGQRGMKTLERYAFIQDAEIRYIVDVSAEKIAEANDKLLLS